MRVTIPLDSFVYSNNQEAFMVRSIAFVTAAALACVSMASPASAQDAGAKGKQIFTDQKCSLCHSVAGKGNVKGPLDDVGSRLTADEIRSWITDAPAMAAKANATRTPAMKKLMLPKKDLDALVAYLSAMKKK